MKKIILILVTGICVSSVFAQQFPLQSQYQFNYSSINPAAVGENNYMSIRASYRNQWVNFTDRAISTQHFNVSRGFGSNGLGLTLLNDQTGGAYNNTGIKLSYSHKVVVAESEITFGSENIMIPESELFLGVSGGATRYNLNMSTPDPAVIRTTDLIPEATFGVYYKIGDLNLGVSIPGILNANIAITESNDNIEESHIYTMLSYNKYINDFWSLHPSVLFKTTKDYNQYDLNINAKFRDQVWFGASYREDFGPTAYIGIDFGQLFSVYSHDIATNKMANHSNGSHEVTIGYDFRPLTAEERAARKKKKEQAILDSDNDGVVDSLDLCPNIAGDIDANGCPDFDKDGVPDKYDLCPELPGNVEAGCPDLTDREKAIIKDVIENLRFEVNSAQIKQSSYYNLAKLAVMLQQNPNMFLEIHGHASAEGTSDYNLILSAKRAKSVEKFFLSRGIDQNKLFIRFYGEESPLNNNLNENQRSENRRVEFTIRFHLNDRARVVKIQEEYRKALESINIIADNNVFPVETLITEDQGLKITETENEIIIEKEVEEQLVDNVVIDTDISNEEIIDVIENTTEVIEEDNESIFDNNISSNNPSDHLLIVSVFSTEENANNYINKSGGNLSYKKMNGKYYVYAFSSPNKSNVVQFKSTYKKDSWIWSPKK